VCALFENPGERKKRRKKKKKEGKGKIHARDMEKERVGGEGRRGWREAGETGMSPGEGRGERSSGKRRKRKKKKKPSTMQLRAGE